MYEHSAPAKTESEGKQSICHGGTLIGRGSAGQTRLKIIGIRIVKPRSAERTMVPRTRHAYLTLGHLGTCYAPIIAGQLNANARAELLDRLVNSCRNRVFCQSCVMTMQFSFSLWYDRKQWYHSAIETEIPR